MPDSAEKQHLLSASWAVREVDHLIHRLGRYTRFVAFSKWGLAIFAILTVGFVIAWPHINKSHEGMRISFLATSTPIDQQHPATPPVMANPVYDGISANGQPFKVTGTQAIQQSAGDMLILNMQSQLFRSDSSWVKLSADQADYFPDRNYLKLTGNVTVIDQNGYTFTTDMAEVDTKAMHVVGHDKITGTGPTGSLLATGFEIMDNGQQIHFGDSKSDRVTVHIDKAVK